MGDNPYQDDRGNRDASITNPNGTGTLKASPGTGRAMKTSEAFLIGDTMTGGYGKGPDILHACTVAVNRGEIAVIVGPNGAGKSTAMKAIFGMLDVRQGSVRLDGEDITSLSPQDRVIKGMGFVPQTSNIFTSMTVEENLEMGAFIR
ncbi:MAG: ATP-binding cassette domain-containing protein, partial [Rhodobacteraceae bacterium]